MSPRRHFSAGLCLLIDALAAAFLAAVLVSVIVGGLSLEIAGTRVRLTSLTNPTVFLAIALTIRYFAGRDLPFLGARALRFDALARRTLTAAADLRRPIPTSFVWVVVGGASLVALLTKLACAWFLPGFFSGDDVEIHEMTLSALFGWDLPIWNLRSAFFPLGFVFPGQWVVARMGIEEPRILVFVGRATVAVLSTAAIGLTWFAARRVEPGNPAVALLAVLLFATNKLHISFGSSELPRPVSTVFVLGAFALLWHARGARLILSGSLLGIATAFRFSEVVFGLSAVSALVVQRRWRDAFLVNVGLVVTLGAVVGAADYLYWGTPLASLWNAVDYTLVDRASSRGYEPPVAYVLLVPQWTNWAVFGLALVGCWRNRTVALWMLIPILALSMLPHKETRYLVPVVPYLCMAAAIGFLHVVQSVSRAPLTRTREAVATLVPVFLILGVLQDIGGWRLRRSNEEVRLADWVREQSPGGVAVRHVWRFGGGIYLHGNRPVVEIDDPRLESSDGRRQMFRDVQWIVVDQTTAHRLSDSELNFLGFRFVAPWEGGLRVFSRQ